MSDQRAGLFHQQQRAQHGGPHRGYLTHYLVFGYRRSFPFKHPPLFTLTQRQARTWTRTDRTQKIWPADMTKGHKTKEMKTKTIQGGGEGGGNDGKRKIRGDFIRKKTPAAGLLKLEERKPTMTPYRLQPSVSTRSRSALCISARMLDVAAPLPPLLLLLGPASRPSAPREPAALRVCFF